MEVLARGRFKYFKLAHAIEAGQAIQSIGMTIETIMKSGDTNVREGFVDINSVPVPIRTWGKWIHDSLEDVQEIILILPGMIGGIPAVYSEMLNSLYENLNHQIPIWAVGE